MRKRQPARARRRREQRLRAERGQGHDPVGRGIGVREASADRAAIAHRPIGDAAGDGGHPSGRGVRGDAVLDLGMGDRRAINERVAFIGRPPHVDGARNVDQALWTHKPEIEHRSEGLAAGGDRLRAAGGPGVCESGGLHWAAPFARASAASTCYGVIGNSPTAAPRSARASFTALAIAAGGPMAPVSPMPFWPKCVSGDGVSMCGIRIGGISAAPGSR